MKPTLWLLALCFVVPAFAAEKDVYRYHGLKKATGSESKDGVFQDFELDNENVGQTWADPDAVTRNSADFSWVRAHINRDQEQPHLTIEFSRQGYGASLAVMPKNKVPEKIPKSGQITFEMRSRFPACVGMRIMERDGEVWGYGAPPLEYQQLCVDPDNEWQRFEIPIVKKSESWFRFKHSGNTDLGNKDFDADLVAALSFELGLEGKHYFRAGLAELDVRDIRVLKAPTKAQVSE